MIDKQWAFLFFLTFHWVFVSEDSYFNYETNQHSTNESSNESIHLKIVIEWFCQLKNFKIIIDFEEY